MEIEFNIEFTACEIRRRRKALHMSQDELAEKVFCTQDAISRIERGIQEPTFQFLCVLAKALHCTPNDLSSPNFGFEVVITVSSEQYDALMDILRRILRRGKP